MATTQSAVNSSNRISDGFQATGLLSLEIEKRNGRGIIDYLGTFDSPYGKTKLHIAENDGKSIRFLTRLNSPVFELLTKEDRRQIQNYVLDPNQSIDPLDLRYHMVGVLDDSMTDPHNPGNGYSMGCYVCIDTMDRGLVSNETDLIAFSVEQDQPLLRRYVVDDSGPHLMALNPSYPRTSGHFRVIGTVVGRWNPSEGMQDREQEQFGERKPGPYCVDATALLLDRIVGPQLLELVNELPGSETGVQVINGQVVPVPFRDQR